MFPLGHLGVGSRLVRPFTKGLSRKAVLLGTILPDLIDKPLYYLFGVVPGTRTFGHTGVFLLSLTFIAVFKKSRVLAACSLGIVSHLLLDSVGGGSLGHTPLLWPILGWEFPTLPYTSIGEHLSTVSHPFILIGELVGLSLLILDYKKTREKKSKPRRRPRLSSVKPHR